MNGLFGLGCIMVKQKKKKVDLDGSVFFQNYRKRGFSLTLEILDTLNDDGVEETEFFAHLKNAGSYLNEFYRVKKELLEYGLISYKLNEDYNKVIFLTDTGRKVLEMTEEINEVMLKTKKISTL